MYFPSRPITTSFNIQHNDKNRTNNTHTDLPERRASVPDPGAPPFPFHSQLAPESGLLYDFMYEKRDTGRWVRWLDTVDKALLQIPPNAKVGNGH